MQTASSRPWISSPSWPLCLAALVAAACLAVAATSPARADIPRMINYQCLVTDKETGEPLPGEHHIAFHLYDVPSGGTPLWSEEHDVTADTTGVVSVLLGSEDEIGAAFTTHAALWLEVEVDGEILLPRRQLASVPYAFQALNSDSLGGVGPSAYAAAAHTHDDRYYTETELSSTGTINAGGNPVDWTELKSVPAGLADGTDDVGPGDGYSLDASDGNPTDALYVNSEGRVGIGTTAPERQLHLRGVGPRVLVDATSGNPEVNLRCSGDAGSQVWAMYKESVTGDLRFYQNGDKVTLDNSTGNVGIGTTSPTLAKLQIEGSSSDAVYAKSDSGKTAVFAVVGSAVGGEGDAALVASSTKASAIVAYSTGGSGLYAAASRATVPAIHGYHSGDGPAVFGSCVDGNAYPCIEAMRDDDGTGVGSYAGSGVAVFGMANSDGIPVAGVQTDCSTADIEGYYEPGGYFGGGNGVIGLTKTLSGYGVLGLCQHATSYAGGFYSTVGHGVSISTPAGKIGLSVSGGTKSALVATADGARSLYCEEASEVWFTDYGFGRLDGGAAVITIDPIFAQTVNLNEPYHVFLQAYDDADLYVSSRAADRFEVRLRGSNPAGDPTAEFSYRIVAKRVGYEKERLARAAWADNDRNLYPGKAARQQGEE
jgi:hypothetical protein